ncbi:glycosyltransferase [Verrucomicrobia bacterium]|nr:glycosyltransferase [Verrucomicrobiota bacterium]
MTQHSARGGISKVITVIPVYNGERFLRATLESVAQQTKRPDRLIIIDDGSTDGTKDLVQGFTDLSCEWHPNPKNLGLFPNLNKALAKASEAEFFHLLLADDIVTPDFIKTSCKALESSNPMSFSWSDTQWIDANGNETRGHVPDAHQPAEAFDKIKFISQESELETVSVGSVMIRSGAQPLPCQFRTDMPQVADCVFYGELASHAQKLIHIPRPLCQIRTHDLNMTSKNIQNISAWVTDEWEAMNLIASKIPESQMNRWIRKQRLQCLFAARSKVKEQWMQASQPAYASKIRKAARERCSLSHYVLGRMAVTLRDGIKGPNVR